jgi:hypothetical protein
MVNFLLQVITSNTCCKFNWKFCMMLEEASGTQITMMMMTSIT